jgi:hypothetical protein
MKNPDPPPAPPPPPEPAPYDAFRELAGKLVKVPKSEVDAKEAAYQRERAKKPKPGPKKAG